MELYQIKMRAQTSQLNSTEGRIYLGLSSHEAIVNHIKVFQLTQECHIEVVYNRNE